MNKLKVYAAIGAVAGAVCVIAALAIYPAVGFWGVVAFTFCVMFCVGAVAIMVEAR